jgi:ABC-type glycerol-3-phosphate transport system substrate-binding protein
MKTLSRRQFLHYAATAVAAGIVTACAATTPKPPAPAEGELQILCRPDIKSAYAVEAVVQAWNEAFPKSAAALFEPSGDPIVEIKASQASGNLPFDGYMVMETPWSLVEWVKGGIISPLDDTIRASTIKNSDQVVQAILPSVKESASYEGKFYGFPGNIGSVALAWFWEPLKGAGYDEQPATWDEVYDAAKKIKEKKPDLVPFASASNGLCDLYAMIFSAKENPFDGDGLVDILSDESIQALTWMRTMVEEELMPASDEDQFSNWLLGKTAMIISYDVAGTLAQKAAGIDKADTGINFFPEKSVINGGTPFWVNCSVVLSSAKNPQGMTDFFLHMFGPDNKATGKQISEVAAKPAYQYTVDEFVRADKRYEWELLGLDLVAKSKPFPLNTYWGIEQGTIGGYIRTCLDVTQKFEPEKTMAEAYQKIKAEIDRQKIG